MSDKFKNDGKASNDRPQPKSPLRAGPNLAWRTSLFRLVRGFWPSGGRIARASPRARLIWSAHGGRMQLLRTPTPITAANRLADGGDAVRSNAV